MATGGMNFSPNAPQTLALRPLVNGMVTEGHSSLAPPTSFKELKGLDVSLSGLKRTGGLEPITASPIALLFDNGQTDTTRRLSEKIEDFTVLVQYDGTPVGIAITNRLTYTFDPATGFVPIPWGATSYTIKEYTKPADDGLVVVNGDISAIGIAENDWVQFNTDTTTTLWRVQTVTVSGDTTITLDGGPAVAGFTATTFKVYKPFKTVQDSYTEWTIGRNAMYLVDGVTNLIFKYDDDYMVGIIVKASGAVGAATTLYTAKTITYYKERLWFGNTTEPFSGGTVKPLGRIRWSEVLNWGYSVDTIYSAAMNFSDQDYRSGPLLKLVGSDTILLAFMSDAIYYGQQSNLVGLPYAFYQLQTGNVSLVGPRAAASLLGGCIFVGPDDVYTIFMTDAGPTLERVGLSVANKLIGDATNLEATIVRVDPLESRVVVGTSSVTNVFDKMWFWNYKTKGWSWMGTDINTDGFTVTTLTSTNYVDQLSIDEIPETLPTWTIDGSPYATIAFDGVMRSMIGVDIFMFTSTGYLYKFNSSASQHTSGYGTTAPIKVSIVTQDLDFERPDDVKTFTELGALIRNDDDDRTAAVQMAVEGSVDRGKTWRTLGTLSFAVGDDEDKINFRLTGSAVRFRITSSNVVEPWTLLEMTLRARARTDREPQRSTARA